MASNLSSIYIFELKIKLYFIVFILGIFLKLRKKIFLYVYL